MVDAAMAMTAKAIHKRGVGHSIAACSMLAARLENIAVGIVADGCIFLSIPRFTPCVSSASGVNVAD